MLNAIRKSIVRNQTLEMIYVSSDETITKRRIKVYKCYEDSFVAYCYLRRSVRTFKIDNVLAVVPVIELPSRKTYIL